MADFEAYLKAVRLRVYFGESDRWRGKPLYAVLLDTLREYGLAGATVLRGVSGFGAHSRIRTNAIEVLSQDLPLILDAVDTAEKINQVLAVISPMVREGLITVEDVWLVKYTHRLLNPLPIDQFVAEVMTRDVITLTPDLTVFQAWKKMLDHNVKAMPVVDPQGKVVGILTDEDLLERAGIKQRLSVAKRVTPELIEEELGTIKDEKKRVADLMTTPVITVHEKDSLGSAVERMVKARLKRLPVVDSFGKLVGMLSRLDILRTIEPVAANMLKDQLPTGSIRTLQDVMTTEVPMINQDEPLQTIIHRFSETETHRLVVVDEKGIAIGLISDSDIVARIPAARQGGILNAIRRIGKPPAGKETARDLMSPKVLSARPETPVVEAIGMMLKESRKWLVIVDPSGKPVGLADRQILMESLFNPTDQRANF